MKPSLQLKVSQQLTMTPQLQQAIRLLQLSTLDLRTEILDQLYNNPLLELEEEHHHSSDGETEAAEKPAEESNQWEDEIPQDLPVDAQWDDIYTPAPTASASSEDFNFEQIHQVTESLQDHLLWQLNLTPFSDLDRQIAEALIDSVDNNGFISGELSAITSHLEQENNLSEALETDEIEAVLHRLQQFDPPGVCARDLRECLLIQLKQLSPDTPFVREAKLLIERFIKDIATVDLSKLARKAALSEEAARGAVQLIRSLNPQPGEALSAGDIQHITPDVAVEKINGRWRVHLNDSSMPRLRINDSYSAMIRRADSSADNQYLKDHLAEARWFLRSLESRNETLLRVASSIIELQQGFLNHGPVAMKPMVLADIAEKLELHESTISRVTTNKYMATPRGVFELKFFFSSHVATAAGGECSSTAVCAMLKEMISAENSTKPLSDSKLTSLLEEQGIHIARRTVAKYREGMGIASSSQRKRYQNT